MTPKWPWMVQGQWYSVNVELLSANPTFTPFRSTIIHFLDNWGFWFLHRLHWWIWIFWKINPPKSETQNFKNSKRSILRTIEKILQEKFDKFLLWFVEEVVLFGNRILGKSASVPNNHKMTLNITRPQVPHMCCTTNPRVPNVTMFGSTIAGLIDNGGFDLSIVHNGEFGIFKNIVTNQNLKISYNPQREP